MDAAGASCSVALGRGGRILASRKIDLRHGHAAILVPMVEEVMLAAGIALAELDGLAVGIGPGGFTGLRIALSAARGFGLALGKPVIGITNFQAAAANLPAHIRAQHPGDILVVIDSRREEPYVASLDADLRFCAVPRFMSLAEIATLVEIADPALITGDGLDLWSPDWPDTAPRFAAAADALSILRLAADPAGQFAQKAAPLYLREPDVSPPKAA
jgi:tRNA threonylcarbamoyladenosine biosynthesis protein TsaB